MTRQQQQQQQQPQQQRGGLPLQPPQPPPPPPPPPLPPPTQQQQQQQKQQQSQQGGKGGGGAGKGGKGGKGANNNSGKGGGGAGYHSNNGSVNGSNHSSNHSSSSSSSYKPPPGYHKGAYGEHKAFVSLPPSVPTHGKLMTGGDVASVLHVHLRSLDIADPYKQDFYYHNYTLKQREKEQEEKQCGLLGALGSPRGEESMLGLEEGEEEEAETKETEAGVSGLPLPVWQAVKEAALKKETVLWGKFASNTKEWAAKHQTFGQTQKSNPHRPKALLQLSTPSAEPNSNGSEGAATEGDAAEQGEGGDEEDEEEGDEVFIGGGAAASAAPSAATSTGVPPFSSSTWVARKAIETAKGSLLDIDELRRLLQRTDVEPERAAATHQALTLKFAELQTSLGFAVGKYDAVSDVSLLASVCEQDKGKKLLAKVLKLVASLAPALLPTCLRVLYSKPPVRSEELKAKATQQEEGAAKSGNVDGFALRSRKEADDALVDAAAAFFHAMDTGVGSSSSFAVCRGCLESVMAPHVKGNTLHAALSNKRRAALMQTILKRGTELCAAEEGSPPTDGAAKAYWATLRGAFLNLATRTPPAAAAAATASA
mmetsp:Transcript_76908/g.154255  ORF Transcript_76908/g.154255 Transcript_76908/m.154255 type:complete len:597 (-) Transcript_76908:334-2124(-)